MGYGSEMKITKSQLRKIVKEELIKEAPYIDPDEAGITITMHSMI